MLLMKSVVEKMEVLGLERVEAGIYKVEWDIKVEKLIKDAFVEVAGREPTYREIDKFFDGKALDKVIDKIIDARKK